MRKFLCIISIACILFSLFTFIMMIEPGIVNFDEVTGFLCLYVSIVYPFLLLPLWLIFASAKSNKNKKLQIIASVSIVMYILLIVNFFVDILHIGEYAIFSEMILPIIALPLCIGYSKKAVNT